MTVRVPERAHPLVKRLYEEMNRQGVTINYMAERTGYTPDCIKYWRKKGKPERDQPRSLLQCAGFNAFRD